jgi:AraC-like DNA-binding protein
MTTPHFTLPIQYLRYIGDQLRSLGADVPAWLGRSNLTVSQLDDPSLTITFELFRQLTLDALQVSREPALGLFVGQRLQANVHGVLGYAALSSGSIRQALELFERFVTLRFSVLAISSEVRPQGVRVRIDETRPLGAIQRSVLEAVVMTNKNILESISMGTCRIRSVAFPFPAPDYAKLARDLFGCEVRYGQRWAGFTLPVDVLDAPLRLADPVAFREAAVILQHELQRLSANQTVSGRVRRLLLEGQNGFPSLQVSARVLHMTPRTLHRRLIDEGTSFRALLEDVRHTLAVEYLQSGHFSIEEVAYTLGYSDLANFRRAFKRWESVPPSEFRAKQRASRSSRPKAPHATRKPPSRQPHSRRRE